MFKCVVILTLLYLINQTMTFRRALSQDMYYRRYNNPYKFNQNMGPGVGYRGSFVVQPLCYEKEGGRLRLNYGGGPTTPSNKNIINETTTKNTPQDDDAQRRMLGLEEKVAATKIASLFRNNLIKVFGYILHRPNIELTSELYTSLYFMLSTIKLNEVNLIAMVSILEQLSFKSSNERFLIIFEALEKHLPEYLQCAATFWKTSIQEKKVNMDNILKPHKEGPLVVDVLENMSDELLVNMEVEDRIENFTNPTEQKVFYNFNMNLVQIMRQIKQNKNEIPPIFFSALLLFFPRSLIQPDLEEAIQIAKELLELEDNMWLNEWQSYISTLSATQAEDPYFIVTETLKKLVKNRNITMVVKDSIQIILDNLVNRNPTAINPHYNSIANLVDLNEIKIPYMLKYIEKGAYPIEIVIAGARTDYYLQHNYIRPITLMVNFNPYIYSSPTEILAALLNRVIKRQPDLPLEITDSAGAVYSYLLFTFRYIVLPVRMPDDMINLNVLFLGLRAPDIERTLLKDLESLIDLVRAEMVAYQTLLLEIPVYKCATPIVCFLELLKYIEQKDVASDELKLLLLMIVQSPCAVVQCPIQDPQINKNSTTLFPIDIFFRIYNSTVIQTAVSPEITTQTTTTTTIATTPPPSEGPISTPTTLKPTIATPPTASSQDDIVHNATQIMSSNPTVYIDVLYEIKSSEGKERMYIKKIMEVLKAGKFENKILENKANHLLVITGTLVYLEMVQEKLDNGEIQLDTEIRNYLENVFSKLKHVEDMVKLITTEKQPKEPELDRLIVAVPAPAENETRLFRQLTALLQKQELFALIVKHIKSESYKNIGSLLQAVLTEEIKLTERLNYEELRAAEYYVDKIQLLGLGQSKIVWGVDVDVISKKINVAQIMDNAIGFRSLSAEKKSAFNTITQYLKSHTAILTNWDKWVYYTKCGDFTKALFNLLLSQGSLTPKVRKAVFELTPLINYDENGQKPSFEE